MPNFAPAELENILRLIFLAAGASSTEAAVTSRDLVESSLVGHDSHGVLRTVQYVEAIRAGTLQVGVRPQVIAEAATTAIVDGRNGFGQVVGRHTMSLAMTKAREQGLAAVTLRNSYHTGRLASFTLMAAAENFVGIVMVNAGGGGQSVAPFGCLARRLATNPFSIAAPSGGPFPLVLDVATSVAPEGKVRDLCRQAKPVPSGWLINAKGQPSTDPADFYASPGGALLPLGGPVGYKGFGLSFMIDLLAGALSGAGCCRPGAVDPSDGALMIVLDVRRFLPLEQFYEHAQRLMAHVKSSPTLPGFAEIYVPGEIEFREAQRRRREGIRLDDRTWQELRQLAAELRVRLDDTPAGRKEPEPAMAFVSKLI